MADAAFDLLDKQGSVQMQGMISFRIASSICIEIKLKVKKPLKCVDFNIVLLWF